MNLLHTDRLHLRPCQLENLDSLHELWCDADIRRFLFDDRQISSEEAQSFIEASIASFRNHGYGIWLFFDNHNDQIAGFVGLLQFTEAAPSLIFGVRSQFWGRGYATEATLAVLDHAFTDLGIKYIVADVDEPNDRSIRVLDKIGMSQTKRAIVNERPLLYYEIYAANLTNP
ncbi:GNAT family N-acetyltransferase [Fischerella sp. JS2]|uniref:GNAT family N-acetyltransferase n=1 Tax=Fischerella sp. JS2 TaxID=2597771 RepID=UPI0028E6336D|nr:GNAT family N-acetyltransferase [Fischerella sp. JS2]